MISFKTYLAAKNALPKNMKVDLSTMTLKDRKQFLKVKAQTKQASKA